MKLDYSYAQNLKLYYLNKFPYTFRLIKTFTNNYRVLKHEIINFTTAFMIIYVRIHNISSKILVRYSKHLGYNYCNGRLILYYIFRF